MPHRDPRLSAESNAESLEAQLVAGELSRQEYAKAAREAGVSASVVVTTLRAHGDSIPQTSSQEGAGEEATEVSAEASPAAASAAALTGVEASLAWLRARGLWGARAAERLSDANDFLPNLDLFDSCGVDDEGAQHIAVALRENSMLTELNLQDNAIGDAGCAHLCDALRRNTALTSLKLSNNRIGDGGAQALAELLLSGRSTLAELDVSENAGVGEKGRDELRRAWAEAAASPPRIADALRV
jgi:hypothetical protein